MKRELIILLMTSLLQAGGSVPAQATGIEHPDFPTSGSIKRSRVPLLSETETKRLTFENGLPVSDVCELDKGAAVSGRGDKMKDAGLLCKRVSAAIAMFSGDIASWLTIKAEIDSSYNANDSAAISRVELANEIAERIRNHPAKVIRPLELQQDEHLVIEAKKFGDSQYFVSGSASISGVRVRVIFDTASTMTVIPRKAAARLGIIELIPNFTSAISAFGKHSNVSLGLAPKIKVGTTTFENWPVVISEGGTPILLGLDIAHKIGRLRITRVPASTGAGNPVCTYNQPLLLSMSEDWINYPMIDIRASNKPTRAGIDTGMSNAFMIIESGVEGSDASRSFFRTFAGVEVKNIQQTYIRLEGSWERGIVVKSATRSPKFMLGSGIAKNFDVFLDFISMSACLIQRTDEKSEIHEDLSVSLSYDKNSNKGGFYRSDELRGNTVI